MLVNVQVFMLVNVQHCVPGDVYCFCGAYYSPVHPSNPTAAPQIPTSPLKSPCPPLCLPHCSSPQHRTHCIHPPHILYTHTTHGNIHTPHTLYTHTTHGNIHFRGAGVPVLVEAESLRPHLDVLLQEADYVVTSTGFPTVGGILCGVCTVWSMGGYCVVNGCVLCSVWVCTV